MPGIGILGTPGIGLGTGAALISIHGAGILGIPGIGPIGMALAFIGIPGIGTVGTVTDRVTIMVLPAAITGSVAADTTLLMPAVTVPVAALSVPMSAV